MTQRALTITQKVPTKFGSLYVHVQHDGAGNVVHVAFSSPGKFSQTAIGGALDALAAAVTRLLHEMRT
jgi:hypothetical protein